MSNQICVNCKPQGLICNNHAFSVKTQYYGDTFFCTCACCTHLRHHGTLRCNKSIDSASKADRYLNYLIMFKNKQLTNC